MKSSLPAHRDSLSDEVTRYVLACIRGSGLGPGDKVPSEIHTSAHLGISRGVVREAYRSLQAGGVLEISNGRVPRVGAMPELITYQCPACGHVETIEKQPSPPRPGQAG